MTSALDGRHFHVLRSTFKPVSAAPSVIVIEKAVLPLKNIRQHKILELIKNEIIATQKDLAEALRQNGFTVTQATVSRDIKELGLSKVSLDGNLSRYTLAGEKCSYRSGEHLKRLFRDSVVGLDSSENLIVIKTHPGGAELLPRP